jgi:glycogen synthase
MTKVLMLGWEFPPLFSGGLGIATYGLVKALSPRADIRLIIPQASASTDLNNVNIIGLNQLTAKTLDLEALAFNFSFPNTTVHQLPISISPYHYTNELIGKSQPEALDSLSSDRIAIEVINNIFSGKEIYGNDIMHRIYLFSKLAEEIAADGDFEVIHAHDWVTYSAGINIKNRTGKPLVIHVHALETDRAGEHARNEIYWLERSGMEAADKIIAVSYYTKQQIIEHYQIDERKIEVVHNGIDPATIVRTQHKLKDKLVVFLGRLTHQKGPKYIVETAEKILRVYPRVKFVVAGTGDQFAHLLETSAHKKMGRHFIFTGFLSKAKVNELLALADVYFMPSVSEPFGLTALEAAQHSVPSVISAQSGASEVMKASLKADHWDTDKHANYIHALLRYPALHKRISEDANREIEEVTWDHAADKVLTIYNQLRSN